MAKPVESSSERRAQRVYERMGLGTAEKRASLLRGLGVDPLSEESPSSECKILFSRNSDLQTENDA